MNFVAASILYHAEEDVAFWILILIFEKAEMRDIYMHSKLFGLKIINGNHRFARIDKAFTDCRLFDSQ